MGQAKQKNKKLILLPDIVINESQKSTVMSLIELLTLEKQQALQRISVRRAALNGFLQDVVGQMKIPDGYAFSAEKMAFVDVKSLKASGAQPI